MPRSEPFDFKAGLLDLKGKVAIITGANRTTGLGYGAARHLSQAGARVYIAARNETQGKEVVEKLKTELGSSIRSSNGDLVFLKLDLADPRAAKAAADEFLAKETRLDILVNNAAMVFAPFEKTNDGISKIVTTNVISPFVFTQTLLPLMITTARISESDVRIINESDRVTSRGHVVAPKVRRLAKKEDLNAEYKCRPFAKFLRYVHTKLLIILWTRALQDYLDSSDPPNNIIAISLDPGSVDTYSTHLSTFRRLLTQPIMSLTLTAKDLESGSYPLAFAAAGKAVAAAKADYKGACVDDQCKLRKPSKNAQDGQLANELWALLEQIVGELSL